MMKNLLLLVRAPLLGGLFVFFLPLVGFVIVGKFLWDESARILATLWRCSDEKGSHTLL